MASTKTSSIRTDGAFDAEACNAYPNRTSPVDQHSDPTLPATVSPGVIEPLLNEREAAKHLGISPRTLWGLANSGQIPFVRVGKASKRYAPQDLRAYCERNRYGSLATGDPGYPSGKTSPSRSPKGGRHG